MKDFDTLDDFFDTFEHELRTQLDEPDDDGAVAPGRLEDRPHDAR